LLFYLSSYFSLSIRIHPTDEQMYGTVVIVFQLPAAIVA
jgi:hypothetical protein